MLHAPPILPNQRGKKSSPPAILNDKKPMKLHLPNNHRNNLNQQSYAQKLSNDELTVANLRKFYSSLLEEMAPLHHSVGTGDKNSNFRWKNSGTVSVDGDDDEGYDYSYTPDSSKKNWRLQRSGPGVTGGGGGNNGITGGDWSKDGIRRYYTGGTLFERGGGGHSGNIVRVGGIDVDVGTMNGVEISPKRRMRQDDDFDDKDHDGKLDHQFLIDDESNGSDDGGGEPTASKNDTEEDLPIESNGDGDAQEHADEVDIAACIILGRCCPRINTC